MDHGNGNQLGAVVCVEGIEVGNVLEVVCIQFAVVNNQIGLHIVGILLDVQRPAVLGQNFCCDLQDLSMGRGRSSNGDGLGIGIAAAGSQRQGQDQGQNDCNGLFHNVNSPFLASITQPFVTGCS